MKNIFGGISMALLLSTISSNVNPQVVNNQLISSQITSGERGIDQFFLTVPPAGEVTSIAEFERASGAIVSYPFGVPITLLREIAEDDILTTVVSSAALEDTVRARYAASDVNLNNCVFVIAPTNSYWTRDYGPIYITYGNNQIGIVDFPYNRPRAQDDDLPRVIAQIQGIEWFGMPIVHTGGNYMTNGYGSASSSDLVYSENDDTLTSNEVDQYMEDYLGITDYSVMPDPDTSYIDHIDTWAKYLAPDKVLIKAVPNTNLQFDELESLANYFATKISDYGVPYKVIRLMCPNGEPYANSFILNNKVFVPIVGSPNDDIALKTYRDAMPGYEVLGFTALPTNRWWNYDALHCRVHEVPDLGMLRIRHVPKLGAIPASGTYEFSAEVIPYSGESLLADSVLLFYRINPNEKTAYRVVAMTSTNGNTWSASLSSVEAGSTVQYFIYAADESGRRESHPFVGRIEPHEFYIGQQQFAKTVLDHNSMEFTVMKDLQETLPLIISNSGDVTLNYVIEIEGPDWLTVNRNSGTSDIDSSSEILLTANSRGLEIGEYQAMVRLYSNDPEFPMIEISVTLRVSINTPVESVDPGKKQIQVNPNPFRSELKVKINPRERTNVIIELVDTQGKQHKRINRLMSPGEQVLTILTSDLSEGLFLLRVLIGDEEETIKLIKK